MNTDLSLARRVALHAALADPARLQIVDHLSIGDAAPSDLQELLDIPSNLLSHHLGVLERAGLLKRHRSEADRRRTYVRLLPEVLGLMLPGSLPPQTTPFSRIVFVCTANSARSQLAAALWREASEVPVASAGTHPASAVAKGAVAVAKRHGLRLVGSPQSIDGFLHSQDLVVTVCDNAHEELAHEGLFQEGLEAPTMRLHWSIPDPVRAGTANAFDTAFDDLHRRINHLSHRLTAS